MNLVTVTCLADKQQMLLQAKSIDKFLEPCTHWVVINEPDPNIEEWQTFLSPYYTRHQLQIIIPNIEYRKHSGQLKEFDDGWRKQQVLKYEIYQKIKDDYLILDSKNFFIRPCSTSLWNNIAGCGILEDYAKKDTTWGKTIENYSAHLGTDVNFKHLAMQTPFVFRKIVLDKIDNYDSFLNWFKNNHILTSEFLFYSILEKKYSLYKDKIFSQKQHWTIWSNNTFRDFEKIKEVFFDHETIKVAGLHRNFLSKLNIKEKQVINQWINEIGLDFCFD